MSAQQTVPVWVRRTGVVAVASVAAVAAVVSFDHMRHLAELAGEEWKSWLLPFSVDGMLVSASLVMLTRKRAGQPVGWLAWLGLVLGLAVSLVANVAAAHPSLVGRLVAAWPPIALGLSYELLLSLVRQAAPAVAEKPSQVVAPTPQTAGDQRKPGSEPAPVKVAEAVEPAPADPKVLNLPDHFLDRARQVVAEGQAAGVQVGRGRLARELEIPESQARRLLEQIASQPARPVLHAVGGDL